MQASSAGEVNIAFVNTARILEQAPQAKAARDKLQQEFAPRDADLVSQQKALQSLQQKLERDGAIMGETERQKLERDILSQQRELKRAQGEFSEDLNLRRNEEFAKLQREAGETIVALAKEFGYDLVLEAGVVFASDKVDVTDKIIERLRERFNTQAVERKN